MYRNIPVSRIFPPCDGYVESPKVEIFSLNLGTLTEEEAYVVSFTINAIYKYTDKVYLDLYYDDTKVSGVVPASWLPRVMSVAGEVLNLIRS